MSQQLLEKKCVGSYNKEKERIIKDNQLEQNKENRCGFPSSGGEADASQGDAIASPFQVESLGLGCVPGFEGGVGSAEPESVLNADMIARAMLQLFDNGEKAFQRYKFKIRLNLVDNTNPEFIASLTKDFRNFKKYIPEPGRDDIIALAGAIRKKIKSQFGNYPYIGKFHLNQGYKGGKTRNCIQTEPNTFVAVWWDSEEHGWCGMIVLHDWSHEFDLFDTNISAKQRAAGVKASVLYINPTHDKRERPLTYAEKMRLNREQQ